MPRRSKPNAAMKNIVRREDGQTYHEYLKGLALAVGIEDPTREQLARLDRKRKKKGSNEQWMSPADPDARITKMKDGRTHLAHKAEHAVDLSSGAVWLSRCSRPVTVTRIRFTGPWRKHSRRRARSMNVPSRRSSPIRAITAARC